MNQSSRQRRSARVSFLAIAVSASLLAACGGGGGGGNGAGGGGSGQTGTLTGTVTKGPVNGGTVKAYAVSNGAMGNQLGTATTDANGNFSLTMQPYSGAMMLQVHGGSYTDEATGSHMNLLDADDMTCAVPSVTVSAGATTSGMQVTPLTSMAQSWAGHMAGGMTEANITMANSHVGAAYVGPGADIVMMHPIDPTANGSANGASPDAVYYGMMLAAMSQEAHAMGMSTSSSAMVGAMMDDASDGIMDGMMSGTAINMNGMGGMMGGGNMMSTTGTSQLMTAMSDFINGPMNHSGVTSMAEMQTLMNQMTALVNASGHL